MHEISAVHKPQAGGIPLVRIVSKNEDTEITSLRNKAGENESYSAALIWTTALFVVGIFGVEARGVPSLHKCGNQNFSRFNNRRICNGKTRGVCIEEPVLDRYRNWRSG